MEKITKDIIYHEGIFNSKNEKTLVKAIKLLFNKVNELVDKNNELERKISSINNRNRPLL